MPFQKHFSGKEHIIWDFNGTLMDDIDHAIAVNNDILRSENLPTVGREFYLKNFCFPVIDYYRKLGIPDLENRFAALAEVFVSNYMAGFKDCSLVEGIEDVLAEARSSAPYQTVLSAAEQNCLNECIEHYQIDKYFDAWYGIDSLHADSKVGRGQELIEKIGVAREKCVIVGDTTHDLEVGEALGIDVVLVGHGHQCSDILKQVHPHVIDLFA